MTKLATAIAILSAVDDGLIDLDEPAGPPGSTVRHLSRTRIRAAVRRRDDLAKPGTRRIYSNPGFDALGELLAERSGRSFAVALSDRVLAPIGMAGTELVGRPPEGSTARC